MPNSAAPPTLIETATSDYARRAREDAARTVASQTNVDFDAACTLIEQAKARIQKLSEADRRWIHILRFHVGIAEVSRGLSGRGTRLYNAAVLERDNAATQLAAAVGAKPGTSLHIATRYLLLQLNPEAFNA